MADLQNEGMAIAPGVVETIVSLAVREVEGVVSVGSPSAALIYSILTRDANNQGVDITLNDDDTVDIAVHVTVRYGSPLVELAEKIRSTAFDAVTMQVGLPVAAVDVHVEGIRFNE